MIIPYITNKHQEILPLIYNFRFINRLQIQRFMKHKDRGLINKRLKKLWKKKYLERIYDSNTFGENTKLAIYYIGINGIRFLKTRKDTNLSMIYRLYRDNTRKNPFINKCILIAEICVDLFEKTNSNTTFSFITNSGYTNVASVFHFLENLSPSLVCVKTEEKKTKKYYLVEIFEETLPRYKVRKKIRNYLDFFFSNEWENNVGKVFPIILIVCPTLSGLIATKRFTRRIIDEEQIENLIIKFSTSEDVKKNGITGDIWEQTR